jgi:predicted Zn-dependent protease
MRRYGWYADSWAELAMNLGTWAMIFAIGMAVGSAYDGANTGYVLVGGAVIGIAGQLAWSHHNELNRT